MGRPRRLSADCKARMVNCGDEALLSSRPSAARAGIPVSLPSECRDAGVPSGSRSETSRGGLRKSAWRSAARGGGSPSALDLFSLVHRRSRPRSRLVAWDVSHTFWPKTAAHEFQLVVPQQTGTLGALGVFPDVVAGVQHSSLIRVHDHAPILRCPHQASTSFSVNLMCST